MNPVTDPALLAQLEGGNSGGPGKPVTDPALLAQLEGDGGDKPQDLASKIYTPVIQAGAMGIGGTAGAILGAAGGPIIAGAAGVAGAAAANPPAKRFAASIDAMRGIDNPLNRPKPILGQAKDIMGDVGEGLGIEAGGKVIGKGVEMAAPYVKPIFKSAADSLAKSASKRWFKALGGTLQQVKEIGPEEAQRLGRLARNQKMITPLNSAESQLGNVQSYQDAAGAKIGELRQLGDQMGAAPKFHELIGEIENELGPKYSQGMMSPQQGQFQNAMQELGKVQKVTKIPDEIPNAPGKTMFKQVNRNPLFTDVQKEISPGGQVSEPLRIPGGISDSGSPDFTDESVQFPTTYKNPMFISDQPTLRSTKEIPRNRFEDYRGEQEAGTAIPEYDIQNPKTTDIANKVTEMNRFAKSQTKLMQPANALTDVANAASSKNDAALVHALGSDQGLDYVRALGNFSDSEKLLKILENKLAYETGASRNRIINSLMNRFEHRFGYPVSAEALDRLSGIAANGPAKILGAAGKSARTVSATAANALTESKARQLLKETGGDKEKARERARSLGYEF